MLEVVPLCVRGAVAVLAFWENPEHVPSDFFTIAQYTVRSTPTRREAGEYHL
jgi:hypothetical protein